MSPFPINPVTGRPDRVLSQVEIGELVGNVSVINEIPTPATDGAQTVFTVSNNYVSGSLQVFLDGLGQIPTTDYTETSSNTFTMAVPPLALEYLAVNYVKDL